MLDAINTYLCDFILCFYKLHICFLTSAQDCTSGMQNRIHFRTDMEHNICRPVKNSDVSLEHLLYLTLYIMHTIKVMFFTKLVPQGNITVVLDWKLKTQI
jgi:hypothetical protein